MNCPSCKKPMNLPPGAYGLAPCKECMEQSKQYLNQIASLTQPRQVTAPPSECYFDTFPDDGRPLGLVCTCPKHSPSCK